MFKTLKERFIIALVLTIFDPKRKIILKTNISNFTIRVYLSQKYNKKLKLVTYYSYKIIPIELNYNIYNKELLAIVVTFKQ